MKKITDRQSKVIKFIEQFLIDHGFPPSVREIANHFGLKSASGVHKHIKALVKKGYLSKGEYLSRSLKVLQSAKGTSEKANNISINNFPFLANMSFEWDPKSNSLSKNSTNINDFPKDAYLLSVNGKMYNGKVNSDSEHLLIFPSQRLTEFTPIVAVIDRSELRTGFYSESNEQIHLKEIDSEHMNSFSKDRIHVLGVLGGLLRRTDIKYENNELNPAGDIAISH